MNKVKFIMVIVLTINTQLINAQMSNDSLRAANYPDLVDTILSKLHKPSLSTGYLYQRIIPLNNNYLKFQGLNYNDTTTCYHFRQSVLEWDNARDNRNIKCYDTMTKAINLNLNNQLLNLGILALKYDYLDSNSIRDKRVNFKSNGKLYDSFPRPIQDSVYKVGQFYEVAILKDSLQSGDYQIRLNSLLRFGSLSIDSIKIQIGSQSKVVHLTDTITIQLSAGSQILKYTIYYQGISKLCIQNIKVKNSFGLDIVFANRKENYDILNDVGNAFNDGYDAQAEVPWFYSLNRKLKVDLSHFPQ